ncbi:MAG: preprotein translocase subunit SecE [Rhodocyclales bacterium]|nr:preprotein translocase subunit SecE [Rhodocyclales bacterium]
MTEKLKISLALIVVVLGVVAFYYLGEQPMILRVLAVLAGIGAGVVIAWFTPVGQQFLGFGRESVVEARKVVWPTRRETLQMTGVVFLFVLVMAVILWMTDKSLEWVLYDLILGWKK